MTVRCKLPILRNSTPAKPMPFAIDAAVYLRNCSSGAPGRVRGFEYGRVVVHWADLRFTGKHRPDTLVLADASELPAAAP